MANESDWARGRTEHGLGTQDLEVGCLKSSLPSRLLRNDQPKITWAFFASVNWVISCNIDAAA
jgi:hypothetical protein